MKKDGRKKEMDEKDEKKYRIRTGKTMSVWEEKRDVENR